MKNKYLSLALLVISATASAQSTRVYSDEGFDTKKTEKLYAIQSPGKQFNARMYALYAVSDSGHITQSRYNTFVTDFMNLANSSQTAANPTIQSKMKTLSRIVTDLNDVAYNIDGNRDQIYHLVQPIYKAAMENWGDEVVNAAIANAYFNLKEYVLYMSDDAKLKRGINIINDNPIEIAGSSTCPYTVQLNKNVRNDKIDVYFSNIGLFNKASKKFPEDMLLAGPVLAYENYKDESASIMNMLQTYSEMPGHSSIYIPAANSKADGKGNVVNQLNTDTKWYVWVFRNDKLYYSYMVEPCSDRSKCQVN
jgi:hypothetical protein